MTEYKKWIYTQNPVLPHNIGKGNLASRQDRVAGVDGSKTARLSNSNNEFVDLWINRFTMDLAINGTTAQSRDYREFVPRSMTDVVLTVEGQVANDKEYNRLSEFIRETQVRAVAGGTGERLGDPILRLYMPSTYKINPETKTLGRARTHGYAGWLTHGYVKMIRAGAKRHNVAPSYSFDFVMSYSAQDAKSSLNSIFTDSLVDYRAADILGWMDIVIKEGYGSKGIKPKASSSTGSLSKKELEKAVGAVDDVVEGIIEDVSNAANKIANLFG